MTCYCFPFWSCHEYSCMFEINSCDWLIFTEPPEPPTNVQLGVISNSALLVKFDEPVSHNGAVVTRYKGNASKNIF